MAFDQPTRNRLARFVGEARAVLTAEFTRQLQNDYGLDPERGTVTELSKLTQLDDARRATAHILRDTLAHYLAGDPAPTSKARQEALDRIVREQAFTVLNRLCALRMAEARGLLIESIAKGYQSRGFQLYSRLAGTALGETGEAHAKRVINPSAQFSDRQWLAGFARLELGKVLAPVVTLFETIFVHGAKPKGIGDLPG